MFDLSILIDDFIIQETSTKRTATTYFNRLDKFEKFLKGKPIDEDSIKNFLNLFKKTPRTYNLTLVVIHRFCKFLVQENVIDADPSARLRKLKEKKTIPEPFNKKEIEIIFNTIANDEIRRAALLMLYGGLRITEAINVKKKDIYIDNGSVFIGIQGKGKKEREIYIINNDVSKELMEYILTIKENDKLVNTSFQYLQKWARLHLKDKIPSFHWHRMRKTCATWLTEKGMPFEQVQIFLGHESPSTTEIYTKHVLNKTQLVKV